MNKRNLIYILSVITIAFSITACAVNYLKPGVWNQKGLTGYFVIKNDNFFVSKELRLEFSAFGSTGDGRWVEKCSVVNYKNLANGFYAKLRCSQKRTKNNITLKGKIFSVSGMLIGDTYTLTVGKYGPNEGKTVYHFVGKSIHKESSKSCLHLRFPNRKIGWDYLNPLYSLFVGLPVESIYCSK